MLFIGQLFFLFLYIKINFCFIYEIFKFFNIFRKMICVNMKEAQRIFMVQITNTLNFISVVILTVNDIFSAFIPLR